MPFNSLYVGSNLDWARLYAITERVHIITHAITAEG